MNCIVLYYVVINILCLLYSLYFIVMCYKSIISYCNGTEYKFFRCFIVFHFAEILWEKIELSNKHNFILQLLLEYFTSFTSKFITVKMSPWLFKMASNTVVDGRQRHGFCRKITLLNVMQFILIISFFSLPKYFVQGFVSVLRCSAVLMVWDQCFLSGWQPSVMINTCLMLLQLLRKQLMTAENYQEVKYLLLEQPSFLYTHDIQQGLVYLENGGTLRDVATVSQ